MAQKVLIVGCGDLGTSLAHQLHSQGLIPAGVRRSLTKDNSFECIQADVTQPHSLSSLLNVNPDFVVYCVAATAQSDDNYRQQYVEGLRNVLHALEGATNLKHVFFVSSTRIYGESTDGLLDENTVPEAVDFGGERLLEAESLLATSGRAWAHTILRLTGIYGPGRNRMLSLAADPSHWPTQNTWTNRIHRDDAVGFIAHLIGMLSAGHHVHECYVVTDSCPVSQYEVLQWIACKLGVKVEADIPTIFGGKRMANQRMLSTGFHLKYPDYKVGYSTLLATV